MKRSGYVQGVKSNGTYYFYVRQSYRDEVDRTKVLKKTILKLGRQLEASEKLISWMENEENKPSELAAFSFDDFKSWLEYVKGKAS